MTTQLAPVPVAKFFDNNGNPLAGGQLFTYIAGTSTPQATWVDSTQTTQNTNPVILNARGEANVWLDPTLTYKFVLTDSQENQIWTVDQIPGGFNVTQQFIGKLIFPLTLAEQTAGVTPVNYAYPPGHVKRFGAVGNGATNDLQAITSTFLAANAGDGQVIFDTNGSYFIGTYSGTGPPGSTVVTFAGLQNITVYGNGATILVNTATDGLLYTLFTLTNPSNLTIINLNFNDTGGDVTQTWKGVRAWALTNTASVDCGGIEFIGGTFTNIVAPIYFYNTLGFARIRQIHMAGCRGVNCYYGPVFADQGDAVTGSWWAQNPRRAYFVYGVTGHDVSLNIFYDGTPNGGANACIDIKRYQLDTRGLKIRAAFHGFGATGAGALVNFETQGNTGTLGISALGAITGGSSYTNGTYPGVALTGGSGTGALAQITVSGNAVTRVDILNQGAGYSTSDTLSATQASLGGTGSGFSVPVSAIGSFITGVEIDLDLTDYAYSSGNYVPIQFNSLQPSGTQNPTTTDVYDRISIRGNFGQWGSLSPLAPISVASVQTGAPGRLSIDPSLFDAFQSSPQVYPGFVVQSAANTQIYTKLGNLTSAPIFIDLKKYDARGWGLNVKIYAELDATLQGSAAASMYEYSIVGHKPIGATPVIDSQVTILSNPGSTAALPVFTASGTGLNLSFSNYNGANSTVRVAVEHGSKFL